MERPILVDVDAGTDDALALMILLAGEKIYGHRVVGITTTHGNTTVDNVCRNVLLILEAMGRTDVPVYRGAESPLIETRKYTSLFHGADGFGDKITIKPLIKIREENAICAINRIAEECSGLNVMCLGPLTNLALALRTFPRLKDNIDKIWVMGGNLEGIGNVDNANAEFNFFTDPEAAHIVLSTTKSPITLLPFESCINTPFTPDWRFQTFGSHHHACIQLLNIIEMDIYKDTICWNPCDAFLAAAFLNDGVVDRSKEECLSVELQGTHTSGQCIIQREGKYNVRVISKLNYTVVKNIFMELHKYSSAGSKQLGTE